MGSTRSGFLFSVSSFCIVSMISGFLLGGCADQGGSSSSLSVSTKLKSSTLASSSSLRTGRLPHFAVSTNCSGITGAAACLTPTAVAGKAYYAGIMVGTQTGYSVGPVLGTVTDPSKATSFSDSSLLAFDLGTQTVLTGKPVCCGGSPYPSDAEAIASSFHIYFGYLDVTFVLASSEVGDSSLATTHTVRVVYADIDDLGYRKGDFLYKSGSNYLWCTSASGCTHSTRPTSPIQYTAIANYSSTSLGNQTIPSFYARFPSTMTAVTLTQADMSSSANAWTFTVDFSLSNGIYFTSNPASVTTLASLLQAFRIAAEPNSQSGGFTATLTATKN